MPAHKSWRFQIETESQAEAYRDDLVERLPISHPARKAIAACDVDDPCHLSLCPICAHSFREDTLPKLAALFTQPLHQLSFVTLYVQVLAEGELVGTDLLTSKDSLRKTIARADVRNRTMIIGAIEPEWRATERMWLLHAHAIVANLDEDILSRVRTALRKRVKRDLRNATSSTERKVVLRSDAVTDLPRQLSYCLKFVTFDRLEGGENGARGKPVPLKGRPLEELAAWRAEYAPDDFLFLYGVKRVNGRFVRLARVG